LSDRSKLIDPKRDMGKAKAGEVPPQTATLYAPDANQHEYGTSHFSIVDAEGRAVAMTTTVESAFGSHVMAGGFLLNNQLTDFSFEPVRDGEPVANAVAPGKRPRSSMAPIIAFDPSGKLRLLIGSPGGNNIIAYVAQALVALIDAETPVQEAVAQPHHVNRNATTDLEEGTAIVGLEAELKAMGHEVAIKRLGSGLHGIRITDRGLEGGADPRSGGAAVGD
jgi:gamma-glutamyltranspeptidase/glutathione hydrolase